VQIASAAAVALHVTCMSFPRVVLAFVLSKTLSRYRLASGSVQWTRQVLREGDVDDVVVKIVTLAPVSSCELMEARTIDCHAL
jgi:hypothetical protein